MFKKVVYLKMFARPFLKKSTFQSVLKHIHLHVYLHIQKQNLNKIDQQEDAVLVGDNYECRISFGVSLLKSLGFEGEAVHFFVCFVFPEGDLFQ